MPTIQPLISTFSSTCLCCYRKHPNIDNEFCILPSLPCYQQHFHDWFMYLGTTQICWNLNKHCYYLISTLSMIWQIDASCSPFQCLNMLPFHIRMLGASLLGLITSTFSKYYFKTGTICLFVLSSHVFITLKFNSNPFGILLWKVVKPRDRNKINPTIGKIFRKYKPIRHYIVISRK